MTDSNTANRRWDPIVKITHWGIVAAVIWNALVVGEGSIAHIYAGYVLAALLALRLLWGLVGPTSARFASFPPSPSKAIAHVREIFANRKERHVSHNPLGALMAYAIWACLGIIVASGIAMSGPPPDFNYPVKASDLVQVRDHESNEYYEKEDGEGEGEEMLEEVHEVAVNLLYLLIFLHIGGVALETLRSGRRTVTSMLPGGK